MTSPSLYASAARVSGRSANGMSQSPVCTLGNAPRPRKTIESQSMKQTSVAPPNDTSRLFGAMSLAAIPCRCRKASPAHDPLGYLRSPGGAEPHPEAAQLEVSVRAEQMLERQQHALPAPARHHERHREPATDVAHDDPRRPRAGVDHGQRPRRHRVQPGPLVGRQRPAPRDHVGQHDPCAGRRRAAVELDHDRPIAKRRRRELRPVDATLTARARDRDELAQILDAHRARPPAGRRERRERAHGAHTAISVRSSS